MMHTQSADECVNLKTLEVKDVVCVCHPDCLQTLLMAHALRRVSLSTARPVDAQFAFVSHNPGSTDAQLYCHVFKARHARAVRNLFQQKCFLRVVSAVMWRESYSSESNFN